MRKTVPAFSISVKNHFQGAICEILKNRQPGGSEALDKRRGGVAFQQKNEKESTRMKRILVILLASLMLFSFIACDDNTPTPPASEEPDTPVDPDTPTPEEPEDPVVPSDPISVRYPDGSYTVVKNVSNAEELTAALNALVPDTKIVLAAGTYDMKDSVMDDQFAGQGGWMFLVNEDDVAIVAENGAEVVIQSTDDIPNGALASQDMIAIVGDNVVLAGLTIGTRGSDNKAVDVIGNNATIDSCTFIDGAALYIAEYDQTSENVIDKVSVLYSTFEEGATVSLTSGVGGDIKVNDNMFKSGSALYLTGSRESGWNPVGIDVSRAEFARNSFEAGSQLRLAYEASDSEQNSSLAGFDASLVASNLGEPEVSTGAYGETIRFYTAK